METNRTSLMNLDKEELVNIILRKDSIHKKDNSEINSLLRKCQSLKNRLDVSIDKCSNLEYELNSIKADYFEACDRLVDEQIENRQAINRSTNIIFVLLVILIISIFYSCISF